jgi:hypothetical protein
MKVKYRRLGKQNALGLSYEDGLIEIDSRLRGKKHLEILIHEAVHYLLPEMTEEGVIRLSVGLTHLLWSEGYRRCEMDESKPMQDGS